MRKLKISFQQTVEACFLNLKVENPQVLDRVTLNVAGQDCPEFLLSFKEMQVNGQTMLKYRQPEHAVSLAYEDMVMSKKEFVQLYLNLISPFVRGRDWFLDYHNLYLDPAYIYIDSRTKKARYMYLPVCRGIQTDEEILQFFKSLLAKADIQDDRRFLVQLFQYFEGKKISILDLYRLFSKEAAMLHAGGAPSSDRPAFKSIPVQEEQKQPQKLKSIFPGKASKDQEEKKKAEKKKAEKKKEKKPDMPEGEDEIIHALYDIFDENPLKDKKDEADAKEKPAKEKPAKEKKSLFGKLFGAKKEKSAKQNEDIVTGPPRGDRQEEKTQPEEYDDEYLSVTEEDDESVEGACCLRLVFSVMPGAPENIRICPTQGFITIGREVRDERRPDAAFPPEFRSMGRRHARIEHNDNGYYIVDLGSVNHTYLDGEILSPNRPYELKAGCEVSFTSVNPIKYRVVME